MVFIRVKKVKGLDYYYLVKSQWDPSKKVAIQQTIKYLGKGCTVTINDIPVEHRNNPKILSTLAANKEIQNEKSLIINELRKQVFDCLKIGNLDQIVKIVERYNKHEHISEFYDDILKPVMCEVGDLWKQNKLDIGAEHVCSNFANRTIHLINRSYKQRIKKESIIICTPEGELHTIASNIIESILLEKGYYVHNLTPPIPSDSILSYISDVKPSLIMISVTLSDNLGAATRLAKKIIEHFDMIVLIGGQAINNFSEAEKKNIESINPNIKVVMNLRLETLVRIIKVMINNGYQKEIGKCDKILIS